MSSPHLAFARPKTPASKCFHLMRLQPLTTRSELVEVTGLSQPTVTRAVTALINAGLVVERNDLTQSQGRGRPTIPLELADSPGVYAGIAVGTSVTYIGLFDAHGRTVRDVEVATPMARLRAEDFIEHVMAGLNRLSAGLERPLASVGVTFPGAVSADGVVNAPSLGWDDVDIAGRLRFQFSVPVTVSAAVPAIIGSELQNAEVDFTQDPPVIMALFADDSVGAAITSGEHITAINGMPHDVSSLPTAALLAAAGKQGVHAQSLQELVASSAPAVRQLLNERAQLLGHVTATLVSEYRPATVVVAGSAFVDDPQAPRLFAQTVRGALPAEVDVELRLIPSHHEIVRAIARAIALDHLLREPLG